MSREVRKVPADWQHPRDENGNYKPTYDEDYATASRKWREGFAKWYAGEREKHDYMEPDSDYWEYSNPPDREYCHPAWPEESRTHLQMYETTSEGTPISPVMKTPEELARWLADNKASAFAGQTAAYKQWLAMIMRGWAPTAIIENGKEMISGVKFVAEH